MSGVMVLGSQWGDEGKGKIVDLLSSKFDYVVRYQGGANAGHTLYVDHQKFVLHLIPSGVLHPHTQCVISSGVVLDVFGLVQEIHLLKQAGYLKNSQQLHISDSATLLLPYHKQLDQSRENYLAQNKIGTTGKGIGPAYEDRTSRKALLFRDLFLSDQELGDKIHQSSKETFFLLSQYYKEKPPVIEDMVKQLNSIRKVLQPYRSSNTSLLIEQALQKKKKVLFEGAQGVLLDILQGTYPYVTSSSTLVGAALTGAGLNWQFIHQVVGVMKAYTTRVGEGPFPSECKGEVFDHLAKNGKEFGATTQRKRRCGWLDLVALKYAVRLNGITHLAMTKLDVLSGLKEVKVCTSYLFKGKKTDEYPIHSVDLDQCQPVYQTFSVWRGGLRSCQNRSDLPLEARQFVNFVETFLNIPVSILSVGPNRDETMQTDFLF